MTSCAICGCTDQDACEAGCFWVFNDPRAGFGTCSRCVLNRIADVARDLDDDARRQLVGELTVLAESVDPDLPGMPAFASDDPRSGFNEFDETPRLWRPGDPL